MPLILNTADTEGCGFHAGRTWCLTPSFVCLFCSQSGSHCESCQASLALPRVAGSPSSALLRGMAAPAVRRPLQLTLTLQLELPEVLPVNVTLERESAPFES